MNDLITRLEQATEGSRELNAEIARAIGWYVDNNDNWIGPEAQIVVPHYTTSLDAALTLVPEGWGWLRKSFNTMSVVRSLTEDENLRKEWGKHIDSRGSTPVLALCIAALRARS